MAYSVGKGLSGAASGAGVGASIGGPPGAAIGGTIGLVSGFFGDDDQPGDRAVGRNRDLLQMLEDRYQAARGRTPTETPLYQASVGAAQERARRQERRDASQAAARGLTGSQFEVAQHENRVRQLGESQRQALVRSDRVQREQERSALQSLLQQRSNLNALLSDRAGREARLDRARNRAASRSLAGLSQTLLSMEGGPPLEDELNSFFGFGGSEPNGGAFVDPIGDVPGRGTPA